MKDNYQGKIAFWTEQLDLARHGRSKYTIKRCTESLDHFRRKAGDVRDTYKLVLWPESQAYMDKPWFDDHAILADAEYIGEGQAYFIPIEYT